MKNKILIALAFVLTLVVALGGMKSRAEAVSMHMPEGASILNMMDILNLSKRADGFIEGTKYNGGGECRGFANKVYNRLFGLPGLSSYTYNNYGAESYPGSHVVGQLYDFGAGDSNAVRNLFWEVKPGAIIQMGRRYKLNSKKNAPKPHTAIFFYAASDGSGCAFYEANADGKKTIQVNFYSWADLADRNKGFTVYEPDNYPSK